MRPWVDEGADPALPSPGLVGERGHASVRQLEEDDPEGPDVRLEPDLDPRLRGLGQDAVLVLVWYRVAIQTINILEDCRAQLEGGISSCSGWAASPGSLTHNMTEEICS